jgi:protein SCO1/2
MLLAAAARTTTGARHVAMTGTVLAPPEGAAIAVSHEAIPGYMPAMTMRFTIAQGEPKLDLREGDRVRFRLRVAGDASTIDRIVVTGREDRPRPAAGARSRLKPGDAVPPFALIEQDGRPVSEVDLRGRLTVISFVYTKCPVAEFCPAVMRRFQELQRQALADPTLAAVRLLAVTLDPAFDTPDVLRAYAAARHADPARWRFATGDPAQVAQLSRAFAVYSERNGVTIDHTLATALVGGDGRVAALWRGSRWDSPEILASVRSASGAGAGRAVQSFTSEPVTQGHTR